MDSTKEFGFSTHPAAIFTPRRLGFVPVFTLSRDGNDGDGGIDRFGAWLHNGLHDKVVLANIQCSVIGTQDPSVFFLFVKEEEVKEFHL